MTVETSGTFANCIISKTGKTPIDYSDSTKIIKEVIGPFSNIKACELVCEKRNVKHNSKDDNVKLTNEEKLKALLKGLIFAIFGLLLFALLKYLTKSIILGPQYINQQNQYQNQLYQNQGYKPLIT